MKHEEILIQEHLKQRLRLEKLLKEIHLSETYANKVLSSFEQWAIDEVRLASENAKVEVRSCSYSAGRARYILNSENIGAKQEKQMMLLLHIAVEERKSGIWKRYPEEIFINTMSAFTRFVEEYCDATGQEGYGKSTWPLIHVNAKIFRIGALEYELTNENGVNVIHIHIPGGVKLCPTTIEDSLTKEKAFLVKYFSEWTECPHACESWMLSPALDKMLPEDSNIRWFRSLFDIVKEFPEEKWYLGFVFKLEYFQWVNGIDYHTLREDTSLQRAMKKYLLSGGKPGTALGYLSNV